MTYQHRGEMKWDTKGSIVEVIQNGHSLPCSCIGIGGRAVNRAQSLLTFAAGFSFPNLIDPVQPYMQLCCTVHLWHTQRPDDARHKLYHHQGVECSCEHLHVWLAIACDKGWRKTPGSRGSRVATKEEWRE